MKHFRNVLILFLFLFVISMIAEAASYVCPMHPDVVSSQPGTCPKCGMALELQSEKNNVAILVFDGVQIIDYTAPYEIFGQKHLNVYTVAEKKQPVKTSMNMSINPAYSFADAPAPFILVIPGGAIEPAVSSKETISWIQRTAAKAQYVLSVCNGAFFLAKAGLLDGLSATTFHGLIDDLRVQAPKTKILIDKRYVDNGKIITSAGLSSGIDASLYLLSKIYGMDDAKSIALHLEYNWQPDSNFARANMADRFLPDLDLDSRKIRDWKPIRNLGGMTEWEIQGTALLDAPSAEVLKEIDQQLTAGKKWILKSTDGVGKNIYRFADSTGHTWGASLSIGRITGETNRYTLTLKINRAS
jgi:putative intracellular protease/amidase